MATYKKRGYKTKNKKEELAQLVQEYGDAVITYRSENS